MPTVLPRSVDWTAQRESLIDSVVRGEPGGRDEALSAIATIHEQWNAFVDEARSIVTRFPRHEWRLAIDDHLGEPGTAWWPSAWAKFAHESLRGARGADREFAELCVRVDLGPIDEELLTSIRERCTRRTSGNRIDGTIDSSGADSRARALLHRALLLSGSAEDRPPAEEPVPEEFTPTDESNDLIPRVFAIERLDPFAWVMGSCSVLPGPPITSIDAIWREYERAPTDAARAAVLAELSDAMPSQSEDDPRCSVKNVIRCAALRLVDPEVERAIARHLLQGIALEFDRQSAHRDEEIAAMLRGRAYRLGPPRGLVRHDATWNPGRQEKDWLACSIEYATHEGRFGDRNRAIEVLLELDSLLESAAGSASFLKLTSMYRLEIETALAGNYERAGATSKALEWTNRAIETQRTVPYLCGLAAMGDRDALAARRARLLGVTGELSTRPH